MFQQTVSRAFDPARVAQGMEQGPGKRGFAVAKVNSVELGAVEMRRLNFAVLELGDWGLAAPGEALAEALQQYKGTVIFTSHDRYFMHRVATSVIQVSDGSVKNYFGSYDRYLESVEQEVDDGERERAGQARSKSVAGGPPPKPKSTDSRQGQRDQRKAEKELKNLERKIARLDDEKRAINEKMMTETNPKEAVRLHEKLTEIAEELRSAEERWIELSEF